MVSGIIWESSFSFDLIFFFSVVVLHYCCLGDKNFQFVLVVAPYWNGKINLFIYAGSFYFQKQKKLNFNESRK